MQKKFTVRVQKIGGIKDAQTGFLALPLIIEPEDSVGIRRGSLYSIIEVSCQKNFDANLVVKVVNDTFQSEYFNVSEGSPLNALEKAITDVRSKVIQLLSGDSSDDNSASFGAVVTVLWGNVLYLVQYGSGCSYLIREGRIRPINTLSEGDFSIASGAVRDGDIVTLGSKTFCEENPPEKLLKGIPTSLERPEIASIILKFYAEKKGNLEQVINIGDAAREKFRVKKKSRFFNEKTFLGFCIVALGLILSLSVYYAYQKNRKTQTAETVSEIKTTTDKVIKEADALIGVDDKKAREILDQNLKKLKEIGSASPEVKSLIQKTTAVLDKVNRVTRVSSSDVLYDMKIENKDINPSGLTTAGSGVLLVVDSSQSKFFKLPIDSPSSISAVESSGAATPRFLSTTDTGAVFLGGSGFYSYDSQSGVITKMSVKLSFPLSGVETASSYLGNVYLVHAGTLYKNDQVWLSDKVMLTNITSIAVDGSIYLLKTDGGVLKYTAGEKDNFEFSGLDKPLSSPTQLYKTVDLGNIYVLDKGNSRVVVFDSSGKFRMQFAFDGDEFKDVELKAVSVSTDEKELFALVGTKIYKIGIVFSPK